MSQSHKVFCLNILLIFCLIKFVQGSCRVQYPADPSLRPNLYTLVGTRKIKINLKSNINNYIELYEHQEIEAQCDNYFKELSNIRNQLYIKCNDYLYTKTEAASSYNINNDTSPGHWSEIFLECSNIKWNFYETIPYLPWCPSNVTSYMLARPKHADLAYEHLAVICYDTDNLSFNSVYYTLGPAQYKFEEPIFNTNLYKPGFEINNITKIVFGTNSITDKDFVNPQFRNWIVSLNYKFHSIIQHSKLNTKFNNHFAFMLEFLWWPNLLLNNWNKYILALESHVERENQIYDILAGVSGTFEIPYLEDCEKEFSMKRIHDKENRNIPMYVWNYLQARDNSDKDIVIIGFNSPFIEFYSDDDIIFCPDICQEISWLKRVSLNFRHSIMGIIFCCNVEDVKSSKRLNGFPKRRPAELKTLPLYKDHLYIASSDDVSGEGEEE